MALKGVTEFLAVLLADNIARNKFASNFASKLNFKLYNHFRNCIHLFLPADLRTEYY